MYMYKSPVDDANKPFGFIDTERWPMNKQASDIIISKSFKLKSGSKVIPINKLEDPKEQNV